MVILDCCKESILLGHSSDRKSDGGGSIRAPSPNCRCSCHYPSVSVPIETSETSGDLEASYIDATVCKCSPLSKVCTLRPRPRKVFSSNAKQSVSESNYCDIDTIDLSTTAPDLYARLYFSNLTRVPHNILFLAKVDPFKFAMMDPLNVDSRLIVFSLVDSFTKLSPSKIFENYIKKLQNEGKHNLTVFNLSEPIEYMRESLGLPICELGWPERHVPSLERLCSLCKAIDSWLALDSHRNVAIIYSKRDLSRAALAIAVFLHYVHICLGEDSTFDHDSMYSYYKHNLEHYLQPSQKRYITYFKTLLNGDSKINNQQFFLNQIIINKIPNFEGDGTCKPFIKIYQGLELVYTSPIINIDEKFANTYENIIWIINPSLKLRGEILVKCYHQRASPGSRTAMFSLQFHTGTLTSDVVTFDKTQIDIATCDKRFHPETRVEFLFNHQPTATMQLVQLLEVDQLTKCNSYENFLIEMPNLEYTKGPLDGSLYATISKKTLEMAPIKQQIRTEVITQTSGTEQPHSTPVDESVLDDLLNEILLEVRSFPDVSSVHESKHSNGVDQTDGVLGHTESPGGHSSLNDHGYTASSQDEFDYSLDSISWLQRQQMKLQVKHNQTKHEPNFMEKRLLEELKNTIKNNKAVTSQSDTPEVPIRTSSRNIVPQFMLNNTYKSELSFEVPVDDFKLPQIEEQTQRQENGHSYYSTSLEAKASTLPMPRTSTPSFPVSEVKRPVSTIDEIDHGTIPTSGPMFIRDTSSFWYRPNISREEAVRYLRDKPTGSFIIRDSNSFQNAYGLAVKVPATNDSTYSESVRHFLIESTSKGVQIKGCPEEPVFSSLAALVYQHSITRISLPTTLLIPTGDESEESVELKHFYENGAACNVLYLASEEVESLTGPLAVKKVIDGLFDKARSIRPAIVHFKASIKGITLTDNSHKIFFRQHYPLKTVSFCALDPDSRQWSYTCDGISVESQLFGFVARKKSSSIENVCLIFAQFEIDQPSHAIVDFVIKLMNL